MKKKSLLLLSFLIVVSVMATNAQHPILSKSHVNTVLNKEKNKTQNIKALQLIKDNWENQADFASYPWAHWYHRMGISHFGLKNYDAALLYYDSAAQIRYNYPDSLAIDELANTYRNIGVVYIRQAEEAKNINLEKKDHLYQKAFEFYLKALQLRENESRTPHRRLIDNYNLLAYVYKQQGNMYKQLECYKKALNIAHQALEQENATYRDTFRLALVLKNLGSNYKNRGDYELSIQNFENAKKIYQQYDDTEAIFDIDYNIAFVYLDYHPSKAKSIYQKLLPKQIKIQQKKNDYESTALLADIYNNTGLAFQYLQSQDTTIHYFKQSLYFNEQLAEREEHIQKNYENLANSYRRLERFDEALKFLNISKKQAEEQKNSLFLAGTYDNIGEVYEEQQKFEEALFHYQKAIILSTPDFENTNFQNNPTVEQLKNTPHKTDLLIYLTDKANCLKKQQNYQQALKTFQAADQLIDLMRSEHTAEASKLFWRKTTHPTYEAALEVCYQLNDSQKAFYFIEKSRAALLLDQLKYYEGATNDLNTPNETELYTQLLQENQADFVAFFVGKKNIFVLKPDLEQAVFIKKEKTKKLDSDIQNFIQNLNNRNIDMTQYIADARHLYDLLIAPLHLQQKRVFIIRDGYLNYLPFETLITENVGDELPATQAYFGFQHIINYDYSAAIALQNSRKKPMGEVNIFAIAPNHFPDFKLADLNGNILLEQVRQYFSSSTILQDAAATKQAFIGQLESSSFNVINLITHATSKNDFPRIYFRDDSLILSELYNLKKLKADLVILTACETGLGKLQEGEGIMSLSRGFAYSGVPSTITTLWTTNQNATDKIIELFYKYLNQNLPKDEALQRAKIDYLKTAPLLSSSPYHWAALTCVGNIQPLVFPFSYWWYWFVLGLVFSLLMIRRYYHS